MTKSSTLEALNQVKASRPYRPGLWLVAASCLLLATLACGVGHSGSDVVVLTRLPTLTPTRLPTLTPTANAIPAAVAEAVDTTAAPDASPIATPANAFTPPPTATIPPPPNALEVPPPTLVPDADDWVFTGMRLATDQDERTLKLYGELINHTGVPQELSAVSGTFYNAEGQVINEARNAEYYWPIDAIPQDGRVPFELTITGIRSAADFDLSVEAEPSREIPREDFEFLELIPSSEPGRFCLTGQVRNLGGELEHYLIIAAVLYDSQDQVINMGDYREPDLEYVLGGETAQFTVCANDLNQEVARYEMRAWGL